jgi:hypothetical protein
VPEREVLLLHEALSNIIPVAGHERNTAVGLLPAFGFFEDWKKPFYNNSISILYQKP